MTPDAVEKSWPELALSRRMSLPLLGERYVFSVAAGVPPAVEPGILPGGFSCGLRRQFLVQSCHSGRQDAALYGSQDGCRYSRKLTLNTYGGEGRGEGGRFGPHHFHGSEITVRGDRSPEVGSPNGDR